MSSRRKPSSKRGLGLAANVKAAAFLCAMSDLMEGAANRHCCGVSGCNQMARGLADRVFMCGAHRQRWIKYGTPDLPHRKKSPNGICIVDGCTNPIRSGNAAYCEVHYYRLRRKSPRGLSIKSKLCARCNKPLTSRQTQYCSIECRWKYPRGTPDYRNCKCCGKLFPTLGRNKTACSLECRTELTRSAGHQRRVKTRYAAVETFSRLEIFERDAWRCQICKKRIRRDVNARHPLAPAIDHIIPLSRGGQHTRVNVQAAHMSCNFRKHAKTVGQLRLFG